MDKFFNFEAAKIQLEEIMKERTALHDALSGNVQLSAFDDANFQVSQFSNPRSWRLCDYNGESGNMEEVVFKIQGVVSAKMLPPLTMPSKHSIEKVRPYLRQAITVTGLGAEYFEKSQESIEHIFMMFANTFPPNSLKGWQHSMFADSFKAIDCHARYFSRKTAMIDESRIIPFHPLVDPNGVLTQVAGNEFYHGEDNVVEYRVRVIDAEGSVKYKHLDPTRIRPGDIVELSISFVVYPAKDDQYCMIPLLKGILLLNEEERQKADILRMRARFSTPQESGGKLKRKAIFADEEAVEETQRRLSKMRIDSDSGTQAN